MYKDLIGIPFKLGGRNKNGIDCWGLVVEFYKRLGIAIREDHQHSDRLLPEGMAGRQDNRFTEIADITYLQEGDILLLRNGCGDGLHCGVYLRRNKVLHAMKESGVVISPFKKMKRLLLKVYRWQK